MSNATYSLRVKRTDNVIGAVEFDTARFAGITRPEAAKLLLPVVQAQYPNVTALNFPGGQEGRDVKNKGGEVLVEVLPNGASAQANTANGATTTTKVVKLPPDVARNMRVLEYIRENGGSLAQAEEAITAEDEALTHADMLASVGAIEAEIAGYMARIDSLTVLVAQASEKLNDFPQAIRDEWAVSQLPIVADESEPEGEPQA